MPSGPINVIPSGLLSALGLKNYGLNPAILPDELQAIISILPLYLLQNAVEQQFTPPITVTGAVQGAHHNVGTVPSTEVWFVDLWSSQTDPLGAGDFCELVLSLRSPGDFVWLVVDGNQGVQVTPHVARAFLRPSGGLWLPPGTRFGFTPTQTSGTYNVHTGMRYTPLRV